MSILKAYNVYYIFVCASIQLVGSVVVQYVYSVPSFATVIIVFHSTSPTPHSLCAGHKYFVGMQYHPEYLTRPLNPSPPFMGLVLAAAGKLNHYIERGCQVSPNSSYDRMCDDDDLDDEVKQLTEESQHHLEYKLGQLDRT